jgi:hypothetical protein
MTNPEITIEQMAPLNVAPLSVAPLSVAQVVISELATNHPELARQERAGPGNAVWPFLID